MRLLVLHASRESAAEYSVHRILAEHADPAQVTSYFVWQVSTDRAAQHSVPKLTLPEHTLLWDFGRDMALLPKPSKWRRAWMMARRFPLSLVMLIAHARRIQPDAIYTSQQFYDVWLARLVCGLLRIPHIMHLHYTVGPWLGTGIVASIRRAPYVLTVSQFIRQQAIDAGASPEHVHALLNPVDLQRFNLPRDPATLRREFGWSQDTLVITAAGRLDPSKGHLALIEAFAQVHAQLPQSRLLICGEHSMGFGYDQVLKQRVAALGLAAAVVFAGNRRDLPMIFSGTDVFCLPTELDPCPLVFLEAMAASVPSVAYRSGGVPEMVADGATGLLAEPGDGGALATNLLRLLEQPALAAEMGAAGRHRVQQRFEPQLVAVEWAALLARMQLGQHSHTQITIQ